MRVAFDEWLPDLPDFENPGLTEAKNVIPQAVGYKSFPSLAVFSGNALSSRCQGAILAKDAAGNTINFAGNATKLYKLDSATFSDISKIGGYSVNTEEVWQFAVYNTRVIAVNIDTDTQSYVIGTSSTFANLSASAPRARCITTARNFVIVGNTYDTTDGSVPHRVRWSALEDPTSWTVSASTQSDYQDLDASNGWVLQVIGGEYVTIFQERAITRMTYVGSPLVWQFDEVENGKGALTGNSVVKVGNVIAYLGIDGFYIFDGNTSYPIGADKVNKHFFNDVNTNYLHRICTAVDFDNNLICWAYPSSASTTGDPDKILMYNYVSKRWSYASVTLEFLANMLSAGYNVDTATFVTDIDAEPYASISIDSRFWTGDNLLLCAFDTDHKLNNFSGTALTALLETSERQLVAGQRSNINMLQPIIDGSGTVTVQIGERNLFTDSPSWGSAISLNDSGLCPVRSNARYHRFRVNISGGFSVAQGIDIISAAQTGGR